VVLLQKQWEKCCAKVPVKCAGKSIKEQEADLICILFELFQGLDHPSAVHQRLFSGCSRG
jgi:hypothetical protein